MKKTALFSLNLFILAFFTVNINRVYGQCGIITTVAGTGTPSYSTGSGVATAAMLFNPYGVALDASGNIFFTDEYNYRVRRVTPAGYIANTAGNGTYGYSGDGYDATSAKLSYPKGIAVDATGTIYIADANNNRVRYAYQNSSIYTMAGTGTAGFSGDGGNATAATFSSPSGLALDALGNLYVADQGNYRIRKVNAQKTINTFAGNGGSGFSGDGGQATAATFGQIEGIFADIWGNLIVADYGNNRVRKIDPSGIVSTIAGTGTAGFSGDGGAATAARLNGPTGVAVDFAGNVYISDLHNHRIRKISTAGIISTIAGSSTGYSGDGGAATAARISEPTGIVVDGAGNVFFAEQNNHILRKISSGNAAVSPISGPSGVTIASSVTLTDTTSGGTWSSSDTTIARVSSSGVVTGVALGTVQIIYSVVYSCGTSYATKTFTVSPCPYIYSTYAGAGFGYYGGDNGPARSAYLNGPSGVAADNAGNVYIADATNNRVRKVTPTGIITTLAGTDSAGYSGDGGPASNAKLNNPFDVAVDTAGNVYISDQNNYRIRKVTPAGIISTYAGTGVNGTSGDGGAATAARLLSYGLATDKFGNVFFTDRSSIRKISPSGIITRFGGSGSIGHCCDGSAATAAMICNVYYICADTNGNIYFTEHDCNYIRGISTSGTIFTVYGNISSGFSGDGGPATAATFNQPGGIKWDRSGNLYICDNGNNRLRVINSSRIINSIAGTTTSTGLSDGSPATAVSLPHPTAVALDNAGNIFVADQGNNAVRKLSLSPYIAPIVGPPSVVAGTSVVLRDTTRGGTWSSSNTAIATVDSSGVVFGVSAGNVTVTYTQSGYCGSSFVSKNITVKPTTCNIITTIVGNGTAAVSGDGGPATSASTFYPRGVAVDKQGNIYIAEYSYGMIRKVSTSGIITTIAGPGTPSTLGDGGPASAAYINQPNDIKLDKYGNIYFAEQNGNRVRKIDTSGIISTVAGNGTSGIAGDGGPATAANLSYPNIITLDDSGNLFISDPGTELIRKVNSSGIISTIAGIAYHPGYSGDGGPATAAEIHSTSGLYADHYGNLYLADQANSRIRKISPSGVISTVVGNGSVGYSGDGGPASAATVSGVGEIIADQAGNILFTDGYKVRKVDTHNVISTLSGAYSSGYSGDGGPASTALFGVLGWLAIDSSGNVFVVDCGNNRIRKIGSGSPALTPISGPATLASGSNYTYKNDYIGGTWSCNPASVATIINYSGVVTGVAAGNAVLTYSVANTCGASTITKNITVGAARSTCNIITTLAGTGTAGVTGDGGAASAATLSGISDIATDQKGNIYLSDYYHNVIRKVSPSGTISLFAGGGSTLGDGGPATNASFSSCYGLAIDKIGNVFVADGYNNLIRKIDTSGIITTVAGTRSIGSIWSGDWGPATLAHLNVVSDVAVDGAGNLYIADGSNNRIRKVDTSGIIYTIAGTGTAANTGDGGPASLAMVVASRIASDWNGNIYFTSGSSTDTRIRRIDIYGNISTFAGNGGGAYSGPGGPATATGFYNPAGICISPTGDIFFASSGDNRILRVNPAGIISTFAGTGTSGYAGDGSAPISARFNSPVDVAIDTAGNMIISDFMNYRIRKIASGAGGSIGAISGPSTVCTGANITLTDTTAGGTWSSSNSAVATVTSSGIVTGVAVGTATITYSATTACGAASATTVITVNAATSAGAISGTSTICVGGVATLSETVSGGTWSSSNTAIASISTSGVVNGISAGTAIISYNVGGSCGAGLATTTITVNATPTTPAIITGTTTICNGTNTTLADATSGGTWSSSNTSIASINASGTVYGIAVGSVIISYTVTNSCGVAARTASFTVSNSATAGTISGASTVCTAASTTFTNTASGGTWSSSNASIATVNTTGVVSGVAAGTATISCTVTAACGSVVATKVITVNLSANAGTVSGSATACTGTTAVMTNTATGGTWSSSSTAIATISSSGIVTPVAAGTVNISYTVSNTCGTAVATKTVTVNVGPVAGTLTGSSNVCAALSTNITPSVTGGTWSSSNTSVASVNSTGTVTGISPGSVTISYSVSNTCGTAVAGKVITVGSLPTAGTLSGATSLCTGATTTMASTISGGSWLTSNTAIATIVAATGVLRGVSAGTVTVSYYVSSTCATAIATRSVMISASASAGSIVGLNSVCAGSSTTLTDAASGGTWSSSNTAVASVTTTGGVVGIAAGSATITYAVASGCGSAYATKAMAVNPRPTVGAISGPTSVCAGSTITLTDPVSGGGWISSTTSVATISATGVVTALAAGTTAITYFVSNSCGTSTASRNVTVSNLSAGSISGLSTVAVGASIILTASSSGGTWTSLNTSLATVSATGTVRAVAAGTDTIKYTVTGSCGTASVSKVINITSHREMTGPAGADNDETGSINIYPNPSNGAFTLVIDQDMETATVVISDVSGKVVEIRTGNEKAMYFVLNNVAAGAYLVQVDADGKRYVRKIIVQ